METNHSDHSAGPHGYIQSKDGYLKRLRRIEGQARGLRLRADAELELALARAEGVRDVVRAGVAGEGSLQVLRRGNELKPLRSPQRRPAGPRKRMRT